MAQKRNVVLYLDKDLIEKTRELGFNLSKTFENHLKQLINSFQTFSGRNTIDCNDNWWAGPDLNQRPLARKANVHTKLDDRPLYFHHWRLYLSFLAHVFLVDFGQGG
jgi:hypothetical protein